MQATKLTLALAATAGFALTAAAQPPAPPQGGQQGGQPEQPRVPQPDQQETVDVSDSDLDTFATIYVEVQEITNEYRPQIQSAENSEEAQELQGEMRDSSMQTIQDHDWTVQKYTETARAINGNEELRQEAMSLIEDKSS